MKFPVSVKKAAISAPICRLVIDLYALGGSGAILAQALILHLLAMDGQEMPRIDLQINTIDFDAKSDAQAMLYQTAEVLSSMLTELSRKQDVSRVLGALRSVTVANASVLNETECGETVGSCVRKLANTPKNRADLVEGLQILVEEKTRNIQLGAGGYGSPVAGALITASHASGIKEVVDSQLREAQQDSTARHIHLVAGGLGGATGFSLVPEILRNLSGQEHVFVLLDGGVFLPHSNAFNMENYQGTRDVAAKADAALNGLYRQNLLKNVRGVVLRPLNRDGAAHKLCAQCKTENAQHRHTSVEYLLGAEEIIRMIMAPEGNQPGGIIDLAWNPDMEDRPLGWQDLGMDGVKYHRLLRKLAVGAASRQLIWSKDDHLIRNIPAISSILRRGEYTMAEIKEAGTAASTVCHSLLQMFWDFAVTGSNLENLDSDLFTIDDRYRLLNIQAVEDVLRDHADTQFPLSQLSSYREFTAQSGKRKEKTVQLWNGKITVKKAVDSAASAQSPTDFYIRLFRSVS